MKHDNFVSGIDRESCKEIAVKLPKAFAWEDTREGYKYWARIFNRLISLSREGKE